VATSPEHENRVGDQHDLLGQRPGSHLSGKAGNRRVRLTIEFTGCPATLAPGPSQDNLARVLTSIDYYAFDPVELDGEDLTGLPLTGHPVN
jgi:hypothetical protein